MKYEDKVKVAEQSVIGSVFLDNNCYEQTGLKPDYFYDPKLKLMWEVMGSLREKRKPIDDLTISQELGEALDNIGGFAFISQCALGVPTADNVMHYADIVREAWLTRRVKMAAANIVTQATQGVIGESLLDVLTSSVESILQESGRGPTTLRSVVEEQLGVVTGDTKPTGLPTGIGLEKFVPGGLPNDKVTVIFADAGNFKTTVKNHLLSHMAAQGKRVLDVSLEDACELTAHRYLSRITGIPYGRIAGGQLTSQDKEKLKQVTPEQFETTENILTGESIAPRIDDIIRLARQQKYAKGLDLVSIDYIQLLDGKGQKETLDEAIRKAQLAAKRDKIGYLFLSQIKQDVVDRENPRPRLQDMLGSSAMRIGAKLAIGLFRPFNHCPGPVLNGGPYQAYAKFVAQAEGGVEVYPNLLEVWVVKNVLGPAQKALTVRIRPEVGMIEPFDMSEYYD